MPEIATKHSIQSTISPDAPLKLSPNPSNSMGPVPCLNRATTTTEAMKAKGSPIVASMKWAIVLTLCVIASAVVVPAHAQRGRLPPERGGRVEGPTRDLLDPLPLARMRED